MSALLRAARGNADERTLAGLYAEARRIEAKLAQDRQEHEAHLADAAEAMARGEEVDGLTALLLRAKAENAARDAAAAATRGTPPKRLEARPDVFIADSAGNVAAPAAAPIERSSPDLRSTPAEALSADRATTFAPAAAGENPGKPGTGTKPPPETAAAWTAPEPAPAPKPAAKPSHPGAGIPGFAEFLSEKETLAADAERARKVEEARARGQPQLGPAEAFPPDPREPPEVVTLGRVAGGRGIRRVN